MSTEHGGYYNGVEDEEDEGEDEDHCGWVPID
jgi:hypothetical protein